MGNMHAEYTGERNGEMEFSFKKLLESEHGLVHYCRAASLSHVARSSETVFTRPSA